MELQQDQGYIEFELEQKDLESEYSKLYFSIDGGVEMAFHEEDQRMSSGSILINGKGTHIFQWRFHRHIVTDTPTSDKSFIYKIQINGTMHGGHIDCVKCQPGNVRGQSMTHCEACPVGMSQNEDHSYCVDCQEN